MIEVLRELKKEFEKRVMICYIAEVEEVLIDVKPAVVLTPLSEKWEHNLLGEPKNKSIRFIIKFFKEHIDGELDIEIENSIEILKEVLTSDDILAMTTKYGGTTVSTELTEECTTLVVTADVNLIRHLKGE